MTQLKNMHSQIYQQLDQMQLLTADFRDRKEKQLVKAFLKIMNKLGDELAEAK